MRIHSIAILYFDAVRKAGSIREAARHLNVASSAVNRQILKLEAEIRAPLFERLPGGLKLSSAGEVLMRHVGTVLRDAARAQAELDSLKGVHTGRVEVIAAESLTTDFLPTVIGNFRKTHAGVRVKVLVEGSLEIPAAVVNGDVDLGFAYSVPQIPDLHQLAMVKIQLGAVVTPDHPLAGRLRVTMSECADYPLIMSDDRLSLYKLLHPIIVEAKLALSPMIEANSIELMKNLAERRLGVAFMSRIGLERSLSNGALVHIPLEDRGPVYTELGLYARGGVNLAPAVEAFARVAIEEMAHRARQDLTSVDSDKPAQPRRGVPKTKQ